MEIVEAYTRSYFEDMDALGVVRPDISPRASGHIPEQIEMIKTLLDKGYAYEANGRRLLRRDQVGRTTASSPGAGWRSRRKARGWRCATRSAIPPTLRCGRVPNRSIFCAGPVPGVGLSGLAHRVLGHGHEVPGRDLRHSRRRAGEHLSPQRVRDRPERSAHRQAVRPLLDAGSGSLTIDGVKMSKSLGNFLTIKDALKKASPRGDSFFYPHRPLPQSGGL